MGVALQHPQFLVTRDATDLDHVETAFEQATDALVTEIMEAQRLDARADQQTTPCLLQRARRHWEDSRLIYVGTRLPIHQCVERAL